MANVLVVNCGSSSLKAAVLCAERGTSPLVALAQRIGTAEASCKYTWHLDGDGSHVEQVHVDTTHPDHDRVETETEALPNADHKAALEQILKRIKQHGLMETIVGVGHRVVHGGTTFHDSAVIHEETLQGIRDCVPLAPLHNPANVTGIEVCSALLPTLKQVAVFDTAFHMSVPAKAYTYAIPQDWTKQLHVRRYGFHGTSHLYVSSQAKEALAEMGLPHNRIITLHLGNGCSAAAVLDGKSVDTTMGFTPLEGLVMGTRSGSIDPAIVAYVADRNSMTADQVTTALNKKSGLAAVSGTSGDMRGIVHGATDGNVECELALQIFCYTVAKAVAALAVPLGGIDAVVFTGGIGENASEVRQRVLSQLEWMGLRLDTVRNDMHGRESSGCITNNNGSPGPVALVISTNEELVIAKDTVRLIGEK